MMIKVNSNKMGSHIDGICADCGNKALKMPENRHLTKFGVSTWHMGDCDVCREFKAITQARDFGFPIFKVKARLAEDILRENV